MTFEEIFSTWGGGIVGGLIGLLGAAFGIYCSIKNTNGPKERAFMVKVALWGCVALVVSLGLLFGLTFALPHPYKFYAFLMFVPYVPALIIAIRATNRRQTQIRAEEARGTQGGESAQ